MPRGAASASESSSELDELELDEPESELESELEPELSLSLEEEESAARIDCLRVKHRYRHSKTLISLAETQHNGRAQLVRY